MNPQLAHLRLRGHPTISEAFGFTRKVGNLSFEHSISFFARYGVVAEITNDLLKLRRDHQMDPKAKYGRRERDQAAWRRRVAALLAYKAFFGQMVFRSIPVYFCLRTMSNGSSTAPSAARISLYPQHHHHHQRRRRDRRQKLLRSLLRGTESEDESFLPISSHSHISSLAGARAP